MTRTLIPARPILAVLATLAAACPAVAQNQAPAQPGPSAGAGAGAPGQPSSDMRGGPVAPSADPASPGEMFRAEQEIGEWRGSKLVGLDVLGADGQKIADIRDVLGKQDGRITAVVLGVGGVLGLGERLVAVPFERLELAARTLASTKQPMANPETARTGANPEVTGAVTGGSTRDAFITRGGAPDHVILRVDRKTLEAAPRFQYAGRGSATGPEPSAPAGTSGMKDPPPATPPQDQPKMQ